VKLIQGEIPDGVANLAGLHIVGDDFGVRVHGISSTEGALEVGEFQQHDLGFRVALELSARGADHHVLERGLLAHQKILDDLNVLLEISLPGLQSLHLFSERVDVAGLRGLRHGCSERS
jgi:hypothetical protein